MSTGTAYAWRLRTSGENLFVVLLMMAPPSQELEPPENPVRTADGALQATPWGPINTAIDVSPLGKKLGFHSICSCVDLHEWELQWIGGCLAVLY